MSDEKISFGPDGQPLITTPLLGELQSLRSEQAAGFAALGTKLEGKADKADVARLETRLDAHGSDIAELQDWSHDREVARGVHEDRDTRLLTRRQKIWGGIGVVFLGLCTLLSPIILFFITGH